MVFFMAKMNCISFNVNNGATLNLCQYKKNGSVLVTRANLNEGEINRCEISAGDMVMLVNYYQYIKENNIHCGFINPNGKN